MADDDEFFDYGEEDEEIMEEDDFDPDDDEMYDDDDFQGSSSNIHDSSSKDLYKRLQRAEMMAEEGKDASAGNLSAPDGGFNLAGIIGAPSSVPSGMAKTTLEGDNVQSHVVSSGGDVT